MKIDIGKQSTSSILIDFIISILKSLVIPAIWLALSVMNSQITCSKSRHSGSKSHHFCFINRTIFALSRIISVSNTKRDVKAFLFPLFNKLATWSVKYWYCLNSAISKRLWVIELRVVQFWSEIILVISNRTRTARSSDFEDTRIISDPIALHSVPLPLFITSTLKSLGCSGPCNLIGSQQCDLFPNRSRSITIIYYLGLSCSICYSTFCHFCSNISFLIINCA